MGALLGLDEEPAVAVREGGGPFVIVCEHASNRMPRALGLLGLTVADLERHIAFDPGAADLAAEIARRVDGALVLQRYSRLVIDCNRSPEQPDAISTLSETTEIPGNRGLSPEDRAARVAAIWHPFHAALEHLLDQRRAAARGAILVTVHSFNPVYRGVSRLWHAGIITTRNRAFADAVREHLSQDRGLNVGDNQPYSAKDNVDYTIRRHGADRELDNVMIEIRNDLLRTPGDVDAWADRLTQAIEDSARQGGRVQADSAIES